MCVLAETHRDAADIDIKKKVTLALQWLTFERLDNEPTMSPAENLGKSRQKLLYRKSAV